MNYINPTQTDIAHRIKSLLPSDLWDQYRHLSYARMAEVPELAGYADELLGAERLWYCAYKTTLINAVLQYKNDRSVGNLLSHRRFGALRSG